jgi:hypothetical protein
MPRKDYIPDSPENLHDWAKNITDNALAQLTGLAGWDAGRINGLISRVGTIRDTATAVMDALLVVEEKLGDLAGAKSTHLESIRQDISNIKTSGGYNPGIGEVLDIVSDAITFDPNTYQPEITRTTSLPGRTVLMTKKRGAESMNVYMRRKGVTTWTLIAAKRVKFPADDDTPPVTPGQAEVREYRVVGVVGDDEIGQPSDMREENWKP